MEGFGVIKFCMVKGFGCFKSGFTGCNAHDILDSSPEGGVLISGFKKDILYSD